MTLGKFFFKYRSYTPIPFLIPLIIYARPTIPALVLGTLIIVCGELLRFWGISYAGGETRTRNLGASVLVTQGPFSYVRNPLYLGNILIYFGISIMANSLFPFLQITAVVFFYIQYLYIIKEEEIFLRDKFKEKYEDYFNSVNRFIPKTQPYDVSKQSKVKQNKSAAYASEKRTFQGTFFVMLIIIVIYILIQQ
jgi:protein-S-isoprenylcysteine O-methyltransferase Ste14